MDLLRTPRRRRWLFAALYFAEGAPIGFLWWALPALLTDAGEPADAVGALTAALTLPWAFKFAWAPLVDLLRGPRFTERGWILASQAAMAACLVPLFAWRPGEGLGWLSLALVGHALAAATQDVAIDALAIRTTTPDERGRLNGWMNAGMFLGRALFGGWALAARGQLGDAFLLRALFATVVGVMAVSLLYRPAAPPPPSRARLAELVGRLRRLASGPGVWRLLAFAALGGAAFEGVGAMASPLLAAHGGDAALAGRFFRLPGVLAPVLGGLIVGRLADRFGHRPALVGAALAVVAGVVALAGAAALGAGLDALLALMGFVYLGIGGFTASSYALFMDRTDPALGSTQFSAFMGATNLCEAWAAAAAGALAVRTGLPAAFLALAAVSLLALPLVPKSARRD